MYKRLKWLGSRELSMATTIMYIALWHGIWPGYYLNFSLEFIDLTAERTVSVSVNKISIEAFSETSMYCQ